MSLSLSTFRNLRSSIDDATNPGTVDAIKRTIIEYSKGTDADASDKEALAAMLGHATKRRSDLEDATSLDVDPTMSPEYLWEMGFADEAKRQAGV